MTKPTISKLLGVAPPNVFLSEKAAPVINPTLVMGLEIETENCKHNQNRYMDMLTPLGWTVTVDGSLRGERAFEFISLPMQHTHLVPKLQEFFGLTGFTDQNYTDRCSVHVHVNCTNLTIDQLSTFCLVYSIFEEVLFEFVGNNRDSNIYCIPWNQCRYNQKLVTNLQEHLNVVPRQWQKYTAVNLVPLSNIGTVEFRHMHGTANVGKLTQWLSVIGALFEYSVTNNFNDVFETVKMINTISNYEQFFHQVLRGTLPYNEEGFIKLERGVISAKLALIGYDPTKVEKVKEAVKKAKDTLWYTVSTAPDPAYEELPTAGLQVNPIRRPEEAFRARVNATANRVNPTDVLPFRGRVIAALGEASIEEYTTIYGVGMTDEYRRRANIAVAADPFITRQQIDRFLNSNQGLAV